MAHCVLKHIVVGDASLWKVRRYAKLAERRNIETRQRQAQRVVRIEREINQDPVVRESCLVGPTRREGMGLGEEQVLIRVVVCRPKPGKVMPPPSGSF